MVITNRINKIYYAKASQRLLELQEALQQILFENGFKERLIFPITSPLSTFEVYDDIKKEYLVDFATQDGEVIVFNPEYYTPIKQHNKMLAEAVKDYKFYYIQHTLAYNSVLRDSVKEDLVLGFCILNPTDQIDGWRDLTKAFSAMGKELDSLSSVLFKNDGTIEVSIDGVLVGFGRNGKDVMEAHFSLTDLYTVLSKRK